MRSWVLVLRASQWQYTFGHGKAPLARRKRRKKGGVHGQKGEEGDALHADMHRRPLSPPRLQTLHTRSPQAQKADNSGVRLFETKKAEGAVFQPPPETYTTS